MLKIVIIYDDNINSDISKNNIETLLNFSYLNINKKYKIESIDINSLNCAHLENTSLMINTLGKYYREDKWHIILEYYNSGGTIFSIGCRPFSIPYSFNNHNVKFHEETVAALRTLSVIDSWSDTEYISQKIKWKVLSSKYSFLNKTKFPIKFTTCSAYYNFAGKESKINSEEPWETDAQLETAVGAFDSANRLISVPIARIDHFTKGSLIFINFTPENKNYYETDSGKIFLSNMVFSSLKKPVRVEFMPAYAVFYKSESPELILNIERIRLKNDTSDYKINISIKHVVSDSAEKEELLISENIETKEKLHSKNFKFNLNKEGLYHAHLTITNKEEIIAEKSTGFYIYSQDSINSIAKKCSPLYLNLKKSTDFLFKDDKPFAMHGTTYFVTDIYQDCFINFNAYQCNKDLNELKNAGFNILRSGNWKQFLTFFDVSGSIREKSLRALKAYFLTAAKYDLPVQYVLGSAVFNNWDRQKCPIHNPEMRSKTVNAFAFFAENFKTWTNVSLDIINEPSYSWPGKWTTGRPSNDAFEKINWIKWLKTKYENNIEKLRNNWNLNSDKIKTFEDAYLPDYNQFQRIYYRTEKHIEFTFIADFYAFARENFSSWVHEIYQTVKSIAPKMIVMMGRDETLRIPCQQDELSKGNIEFINWHQWSKNSIIFLEYFLNKVRAVPCCGQEHGVYQYESPRGLKRFDSRNYSKILERKLLYSFGNWIQWQSFNNPYKKELSENSLGLMRADRTETPYMNVTRLLTWIEEKTSDFMQGRNEDSIEILTVHPTGYYFSVDNSIAQLGIRQHIIALHYHLKLQSNMILEHLLNTDNNSSAGKPGLIILPAAQTLLPETFNALIEYVKNGATLLISGSIKNDIYWRPNKLKDFEEQLLTIPVYSTEKVKLGRKIFTASFRRALDYCDPSHAIDKSVYNNENYSNVKILQVGKGKFIHCPVPLELADSIDPICELYKYAASESGITDRICKIKNIKNKENLFFYPISYKSCTVYTLVNEGNDDFIEFTDLASNAKIKIFIDSQRACKIWLDKKGKLIGAYIHNKLIINNKIYSPNGDLAIFCLQNKYFFMCGLREKNYILINSEKISVNKSKLYCESMINKQN